MMLLFIMLNYTPLLVLKEVYFTIPYSHLHYSIAAWRCAAAKHLNKIKLQQNLIVKIIIKVSLYKTEVSPIYKNLIFKFEQYL